MTSSAMQSLHCHHCMLFLKSLGSFQNPFWPFFSQGRGYPDIPTRRWKFSLYFAIFLIILPYVSLILLFSYIYLGFLWIHAFVPIGFCGCSLKSCVYLPIVWSIAIHMASTFWPHIGLVQWLGLLNC